MLAKPNSMTIKEWLIKKLSLKIMQPEKVINCVVTHQFDHANDALKIHDTIEISGFGKYIFNRKKAIKKMQTWMDTKEQLEEKLAVSDLSYVVRNNLESKLEILNININILKPKLNENQPDI